eukprot:gene20960-1149_t
MQEFSNGGKARVTNPISIPSLHWEALQTRTQVIHPTPSVLCIDFRPRGDINTGQNGFGRPDWPKVMFASGNGEQL